MKKIILSGIFLLLSFFSLAQTTVITSFYPMQIVALNLLDNLPDIKIVNLTKPQTGCLHDYQLTPEDVKTLETGNIFIANGAGMESFLDKVISQHSKLKIIIASNGIKLLDDSHHHSNDNIINPHVWISISLYLEQIKNISKELIKLIPEHKAQIENNTKGYLDKLLKLKNKMHTDLAVIKNNNIVTFHEAFPYFAREFNLNVIAVIENEPGSEPSARELKDIIEKIKKYKIHTLFAEPQYSPKAAITIANETSSKIYFLDPMVTGPVNKNAYLEIMEKNLLTLKEALK